MPIPSSEHAYVDEEKVRDYLLNLNHPDGGSKAVWFQSLGYSRDHCPQLSNDLLAIARRCESFATEITPFGVKYKATGLIGRLGKRLGLVITVWIVEDDEAPRLVTAYPGKTK